MPTNSYHLKDWNKLVVSLKCYFNFKTISFSIYYFENNYLMISLTATITTAIGKITITLTQAFCEQWKNLFYNKITNTTTAVIPREEEEREKRKKLRRKNKKKKWKSVIK